MKQIITLKKTDEESAYKLLEWLKIAVAKLKFIEKAFNFQ